MAETMPELKFENRKATNDDQIELLKNLNDDILKILMKRCKQS